VIVHVDQSALEGHGGRSDLPIETVKRLTCDGGLVTIVEDEDGQPLEVGRKRRTVTTALRRALWSRDRGCTFPGCGNQRWVEAHHIQHWSNGGATKAENLTLLCSHHHTLLHEGGFGIRRADDGALRFVRGDGRYIPRCGYRLEDMQDDDRSSAEPGMGAWAVPGGWSAALETEHTSMEVSGAAFETERTSMEACGAALKTDTSMEASGAALKMKHTSMEAYTAEAGARPHASTEVRESAGRYVVRPPQLLMRAYGASRSPARPREFATSS
jgi:hypothetical protein